MSKTFRLAPSKAISLWNKFTLSQPHPVPFSFNPSLFHFFQHHFEWKPYYFLLYYNNEIRGVFPLVNTGKAWVSLPHFSYGGVLMKDDTPIVAKGLLIRMLINRIETTKIESGFYRYDIEKEHLLQENLTSRLFVRSLDNQQNNDFKKSEKVTGLMSLKGDLDTVFASLNPNLKRKIRKSLKNEWTIKKGGIELLDDFYTVYSKNIRHLKSLNYGKRFFADLSASYQHGTLKYFVVYKNKIPVGSALSASYGRFCENLYFATLPDYRKYYVSDCLHWQMIEDFISENNRFSPDQNQAMVYSLGRSTLFSSVYQYKSHWPVTDVALYKYTNISDLRNKSWILSIWAKLPFVITQPLGSKLIKHIY